MHHTEKMNPQESLQLINEMISRAKRSFAGISFYFLLWGVLLAIAGVMEYVLEHLVHYEHHYIGWPAMGLAGFVAAMWKGRKDDRERVPSYYDRIFGYLWGSFGITLVLLIISTVGTGLNPGSFIIILTGLPTFVTGGILKFKPLIVGGILFWIIGIISFFFFEEFKSLMFSFAIIAGYIIPGLMLKKAEEG
ncbi:MAG: hypothetical protein WD077_11375 [Bacteroidia bacterium]